MAAKKKRKYNKRKKSDTKNHENIYIHVKKNTIKTFFIGLFNFGLSGIITYLIFCLFYFLENLQYLQYYSFTNFNRYLTKLT